MRLCRWEFGGCAVRVFKCIFRPQCIQNNSRVPTEPGKLTYVEQSGLHALATLEWRSLLSHRPPKTNLHCRNPSLRQKLLSLVCCASNILGSWKTSMAGTLHGGTGNQTPFIWLLFAFVLVIKQSWRGRGCERYSDLRVIESFL